MPEPKRSLADYDSERAVLGAMLLDRGCIEQAMAVLSESDFGLRAHQAIWRALKRLWGRHEEAIDLISLTSELDAMKSLPNPVERADLPGLLDAIPMPAMLDRYLDAVLNASVRRDLVLAASALQELAEDTELTREERASRADEVVGKVTRRASVGGKLEGMSEIVTDVAVHYAERFKNPLKVTGVPFGIYTLDKRTNGWQSGEVTLIASLPGQGKTVFACQSAMYAAVLGETVAFFSLEMSARQLTGRMVANLSSVDGLELERGALCEESKDRVWRALERLETLPIAIDANPDVTPAYILAKCRQMDPLPGLVVVDYIGLMSADGPVKSEIERETMCMRGLKRIAKGLPAPVMVMSQFRKAAVGDSRARKGRELDDLYGSRSLSAESALVIYLQPAPVEDTDEPVFTEPRPVTAVIVKNRFGGVGRVPISWTPAYARFENISHQSCVGYRYPAE